MHRNSWPAGYKLKSYPHTKKKGLAGFSKSFLLYFYPYLSVSYQLTRKLAKPMWSS